MAHQLHLFEVQPASPRSELEVSDDQNTVWLRGVEAKFYEEKDKWKDPTKICRKCWFFHRCLADIPCQKEERRDGREGVFSIRQTPDNH